MLNAITETIGGADAPATKKTANITHNDWHSPASPSACILVFNISNGYKAEAENIPPMQAETTSEATDGIFL